jgi:Ras-related protein Rab-18
MKRLVKMYDKLKRIRKIVIAGNDGIGKTTLMRLFCYNYYCEEEKTTGGCEVFIKKLKINRKIEFLQIWDLGAEEQLRFLLCGFIPGAVGAILGFNMNQRESFLDLEGWIGLLRKNDPNLPIVLIATKADLDYHPALNPILVKNFIRQFNLVDFIEVSSKESFNIEKPFKILIQHFENCSAENIEFFNLDVKNDDVFGRIS